jgi:hypothetical protein
MLWIRDILVRIRIRASDQWIWIRILLFSSLTLKTAKKLFFSKFFCLLLFGGTFTLLYKIKSHKEVTIH